MSAEAGPARLRVLVVDDSVTVRRMLAQALGTDPELEVVGTAPNGALALTQLERLRPDAIVLDLDMPVMDGFEFLERMRPAWPKLPVIVFSSLTSHGAEATLQALWHGATDYVTKPQTPNFETALLHVRAELAPRLKTFARAAGGAWPSPRRAMPRPARAHELAQRPVPAGVPRAARAGIVAIGASTGGPRALAEVLGALPADLEAPVVVVQHMPPLFTRHLADGLAAQCDLPVREVEHGQLLEPASVWVAPGDHHLTVGRDGALVRAWLDQDPAENGCRPSVNPLFRSVAEVYGAGALAVVLTGMGQDGLDGARRVRESHGRIVAQDEATSVVWGMPGAVVRAGLADGVLPLGAIAGEIVARVRGSGGRRAAA